MDQSRSLPRLSPFQAANFINAAASVACYNHYFHNQPLVNVGPDGPQKIFNTTAPTAGPPVVVQVSLPILLVDNKPIASFYSNPPLASDLHLSGDIVGSVWLQTTNFEDSIFVAEISDYNPANGLEVLLDELEFRLVTTGVYEALLIITPNTTVIPAGHRLLIKLSARTSNILSTATVRLFYDSPDRASNLHICQLTPPFLTISKSGPVSAIAGQPITYTLTVTNSGGLTATNLLITDTIPTHATYRSGGTHTGNAVTWAVPSLAPGVSLQRVFVVTATQTITNHNYQVKAGNNISATGQKSVVTYVSQPGEPNLFITKSASATAKPGELITYTLTVANNGDTGATNLRITDTLPAGARYISGGTKSGNLITWTVNSLAAGKSVTVTFAVTASTSITNSNYRVEAIGPISAIGQEAVVTSIIPQAIVYKSYFPTLVKSQKPTILIVKSINTGLINPIRILNKSNQEILTCTVENNTTKTCGPLAVPDGYYKIIASTSRCGVLQGAFTDALPGSTVTREIFCN